MTHLYHGKLLQFDGSDKVQCFHRRTHGAYVVIDLSANHMIGAIPRPLPRGWILRTPMNWTTVHCHGVNLDR